jgi:DNA-binding CsgD family transcriptional regulator
MINGPLSPSVEGGRSELAGLLALTERDNGEAATAFDTAAERWTGFNEPRVLLSRWAAGEARRRDGADAAAAAELRDVLEAAETMGFEPIAARTRRSLRLLGVRVVGRATAGPAHGPRLTARERELVALVERGLTNVEIARRLGLGRPTVARILSSAMTKLGVGSRAQLVATAPES